MNIIKKLVHLVGPRSRRNYWSCSKFAEYVRRRFGANAKPGAATIEGWRDWKTTSKDNNSFVYWFTEEFLDQVQDVLYFPYDVLSAIRYYVYNRFVTQTHKLKSNLKPGQFYELETRLLHSAFDELVEFVEVEKAHMQVVFSEDEHVRYERPWYYKIYPLRLKRWRCAQAGLEYLNWETNLKVEHYDYLTQQTIVMDQPTKQALAAAETLYLYNWWKMRDTRPDPYDVAGYNELESSKSNTFDDIWFNDRTPEQKQKRSMVFEQVRLVEAQYKHEDQEMLIRLIKLMPSLWT